MAKNITLSSDDFEIDEEGNIRIKDLTKLKELLDVVGAVTSRTVRSESPPHPVLKMKM